MCALPLTPLGVGNEPKPVASMRRTDGTRLQYRSPAGVAEPLQVADNSIEPAVPNRCRNLLSKDRCRLSLRDEVLPGGP